MERVLLVGIGGFIGAILRYAIGGLIGRWKGGWTFPIETLLINASGCLVLGFLASLSELRGVFPGASRAFLFIGVLGGFTTFSTFGYETFQLLREAQWRYALVSTLLQVVLGIGAVWGGYVLARLAK